jgi:hypothetical protein
MWKHRAEIALGCLLSWCGGWSRRWRTPRGSGARRPAQGHHRHTPALLGGLIGLGALLAFWLHGRADRNAACYARAIEQLASDTLVMRLGGIYSLERLAKGSGRDHPMPGNHGSAPTRRSMSGRR